MAMSFDVALVKVNVGSDRLNLVDLRWRFGRVSTRSLCLKADEKSHEKKRGPGENCEAV